MMPTCNLFVSALTKKEQLALVWWPVPGLVLKSGGWLAPGWPYEYRAYQYCPGKAWVHIPFGRWSARRWPCMMVMEEMTSCAVVFCSANVQSWHRRTSSFPFSCISWSRLTDLILCEKWMTRCQQVSGKYCISSRAASQEVLMVFSSPRAFFTINWITYTKHMMPLVFHLCHNVGSSTYDHSAMDYVVTAHPPTPGYSVSYRSDVLCCAICIQSLYMEWNFIVTPSTSTYW